VELNMKSSYVVSFRHSFIIAGLLTWTGCKDTIFKSSNDKVVQKQGTGNSATEGGDGKGLNGGQDDDLKTSTDLARKGDGLKNDEDINNVGKGKGSKADGLGKGSKGDGLGKNTKGKDRSNSDKDSPDLDNTPNNRRNRPGLSALSALSRPGGDTPLALDWNHDGSFNTVLSTRGKEVFFDIKGNGIKQKVEWLAAGDVWLALDINSNGRIDDGKELFGSGTQLKGTLPLDIRAENGFEALAQYDDNRDGKIDSQDRIFSKLILWEDRNSNGISESNEIKQIKHTQIEYLASKGIATLTGGKLTGSSAYVGWDAHYGMKKSGKTVTYRFVDIVFPQLNQLALTK
jgi:hypothetical protein